MRCSPLLTYGDLKHGCAFAVQQRRPGKLPVCKRRGVATVVTCLLVSQIHTVCGDVSVQGRVQGKHSEGTSKLSFSADEP